MKKILFITAIISTIVAISMSCRKGPNDPFLSLRSRDTRLIGIWKIKGITNDSIILKTTSINATSSPLHYTTSFTDSLKHSTRGVDEFDSIYTETLIINEDGTYSDTIKSGKYVKGVVTSKFNKRVVCNSWYWLNEKKNKEGIMLVGYGTFSIDRLAWKELVIKSTKQNIKETTSSKTTITVKKELRFKRQ